MSAHSSPPLLARDARFRRRLRWGTALAGVIVFLVPFSLFYVLVGFASQRYVREYTFRRQQTGVEANARLMADVFNVRIQELQSLAQVVSKEWTPQTRPAERLTVFVKSNPWYRLMAIADPSGRILVASESLPEGLTDYAFTKLAADQTVVTGAFHWTLTGKTVVLLITPMPAGTGQQTLILVAALDLEKLASRVLKLGIGSTEESFLATLEGRYVTGTQPGGVSLSPVYDPQGENPYRTEAASLEHRDEQGRWVLCSYRKLIGRDFLVATHVARSEIEALGSALRRSILIYLAPFLALGAVLAMVVWHLVLSHIEKLTGKLFEALELSRQRERERDQAHGELVHRFEEERELARQRVQFQAQLAEYEKYAALAQLALGAAHEINNPLLGILAHLELEAKAHSDAEAREEAEQCVEAAKRISSTLRGLMRYARPGPLQLTEVNLEQLVGDTLAFLRHQPLFHNRELVQEIPGSLPRITADAHQISQILMNLLLNAGDATPEGGRVIVSCRSDPERGSVELCVADTGSGIEPDILPHVFDPFFTTKRGKGTGLGLSITQAYVRIHHGEVRVESVPGRGTTVRILLPVHQAVSNQTEKVEVT